MHDAKKAYQMLSRLNPILRSKKPDKYKCEPYVTPGNVDGPNSPNYGRGGWTWYTGSSGWLHKIIHEWVLGIRPVEEGLLIDPCIPEKWKNFKMKRKYLGSIYEIEVYNHAGSAERNVLDEVDGIPSESIIKPHQDGKIHIVKVFLEKKNTDKKNLTGDDSEKKIKRKN